MTKRPRFLRPRLAHPYWKRERRLPTWQFAALPFPCRQFCCVYRFCLHSARRTLCANPAKAEHCSKLRSPSKLCSRIRTPYTEPLALPRTTSRATSAFSIRLSRCSSYYHCGLTRYRQPHQCLAAGRATARFHCMQAIIPNHNVGHSSVLRPSGFPEGVPCLPCLFLEAILPSHINVGFR